MSVIELTPEEARAFFERMTLDRFGLRAEDFLRRYDAGEYDGDLDSGTVGDALDLVVLRPFWESRP